MTDRKRLPPGMRVRYGAYYGRVRIAGRQVERALGTNLRVAKRRFARLQEEAALTKDGFTDALQARRPITELLDSYLADLAGRVSMKHSSEVEVALREAFDEMDVRYVRDIQAERVIRWRRAQRTSELSHRTVNKKVGFVSSMMAWGLSVQLVSRNPLAGLRRLPEGGEHKRRNRQRLTIGQAKSLREAANGTAIEHLVPIVLLTGFRLSEALALTWRDYDAKIGTLRVRPEVCKIKQGRTNDIPGELVEILNGMRRRQGARLGRLPKNTDGIVLGLRGRPISSSYAYRVLRKVIEKAELEHVDTDGLHLDWHALRHTYCTWLIAGGAAPQAVQALMGHKSLKMTMEVYTDLDRVPRRAAVNLLPSLVRDVGETRGNVRG